MSPGSHLPTPHHLVCGVLGSLHFPCNLPSLARPCVPPAPPSTLNSFPAAFPWCALASVCTIRGQGDTGDHMDSNGEPDPRPLAPSMSVSPLRRPGGSTSIHKMVRATDFPGLWVKGDCYPPALLSAGNSPHTGRLPGPHTLLGAPLLSFPTAVGNGNLAAPPPAMPCEVGVFSVTFWPGLMCPRLHFYS